MTFPSWETWTENPRVGGWIPLPAIVQRAELRCQTTELIVCRCWCEAIHRRKLLRRKSEPKVHWRGGANSPGIAEARLTNSSKHETSERSDLSYQKRSTDC